MSLDIQDRLVDLGRPRRLLPTKPRSARGDSELTRLFGAAVPRPVTTAKPAWVRRYASALIATDFVLTLVAAVIAWGVRFGDTGSETAWRYAVATLAWPFLFIAAVASCRAYESRFLGTGPEEYRRVFDGVLRLGAVLAIAAVAVRFNPARGYIVVGLPLTIAFSLGGRWASRRVLMALRRRGRCQHRIVAVGRERSVAELVRHLHADPRHGLHVVGACLDTRSPRDGRQVEGVPVFDTSDGVLGAVHRTEADTVAITAFSDLDNEGVRRLGWQLEGSDVAMLLAPRVAEVAGPRIHIRPVGGLPLLHVEEPELSGGRRLLKGAFDRSVALVALLLLSPVLLAVGIAVRLSSAGPAIFRQERVGTRGETFTLWKFRTMRVDAEQLLEELMAKNKHDDGVLFKIDDDPRITSLGKHLRRFSIDELPQLVQVLTGRMSLVGPRPPLPREVSRYEDVVHRRLLVKPGLTGLWQVSGRSDLSWEDSVRLDLQYVENWSFALDLEIIAKTLAAVLASRGAY